MQPYFFPYIGYFSLIKHTDEFILLDTVQFIRHG
ncbi:MAG TPA: WbqC family protein, partial [Tenuifilaceae bacterium]|nr:WbqC family protein [Tenuifilaceae bacterium]